MSQNFSIKDGVSIALMSQGVDPATSSKIGEQVESKSDPSSYTQGASEAIDFFGNNASPEASSATSAFSNASEANQTANQANNKLASGNDAFNKAAEVEQEPAPDARAENSQMSRPRSPSPGRG